VKLCPVCGTEYGDEVKFCPNDGQTLRAAAPASNLVGQVVADRYHIIKKLGEGGMGQVYLGEHVKMGRRSAIKVMNPTMVHDPDAVARFNREAANASRITHPNVCAIYDFGETPEGLIYLAMEFIEGEPLTDVLQREGALPVTRAAHIFAQVADALQAAHDLGIVHRDLKPDNIMVSRGRDGADVVKVVDFGIAKAVGGDDAGQKVTKTGLVVGTPEFMSPEQLAGDKVDGRSDLYALALVFFQTLTGRLPFEAETVQETMIKRLTDEPATLAATRADLAFPDGLQAVLDTALTRSPGDRYQTVAKFADDVKAITGASRAARAAVPATREYADGATQLLDTTATKQVAAKRTAALPVAKKRSLVPVVIGAVVLLGGAGAGVMLLGGNGGPNGSPASASDSTGRDSTRNTTTATNPAGGRTAGGRTGSGDTTPANAHPRPAGTTPQVNVALAHDALNALFDQLDGKTLSPRVVRDSALAFYDAAGISATDKAFAAWVIGNAYAELQDKPAGCRWAKTAAGLQQQELYTSLVQGLCQ
jgi:serine/threonine-protein kinase